MTRTHASASSPACSTTSPQPSGTGWRTEQIRHAERFGFERAWVAQHHFHEARGRPAVAVRVPRARRGPHVARSGSAPGVVTLPLEEPVRVAEDATVADLLVGRPARTRARHRRHAVVVHAVRLDVADKAAVYDREAARAAGGLRGDDVGGGNRSTRRRARWTSASGRRPSRRRAARGPARRATGCCSRARSRVPPTGSRAPLADLQHPIVDAYLEALPAGIAPRIIASRTVFVADDRAEALRFAEIGLRRAAASFRRQGQTIPGRDARRADRRRSTRTSARPRRSPPRSRPTPPSSAPPRSPSRCTRSTPRTTSSCVPSSSSRPRSPPRSAGRHGMPPPLTTSGKDHA